MVTVEEGPAVYVKVENRPDALARVTRALVERRIGLDGVSVETMGGTAVVRLVVKQPRRAVAALREMGLDAFESEVLFTAATSRPSALARIAAELAQADVNVEGVVTTADRRLALRTSDNARAAEILRKL